MLSTVQPPKTKQELINQLQRKIPLKFEVLEYSNGMNKSDISKVLDKASKKGAFTLLVIY